MTCAIHSTAVIEPTVKLGKGVKVGPYSVIRGHVHLHDHVEIMSHVAMDGYTEVGEGTVIFPFASIGLRPQDLKFKNEPSTLTLGKFNQIREYVTIQPGTEGGGMKTVVGDHCLFMASSHVAHDCILGNHVILANCATLAGHVIVDDNAFIGGLSAIHQFVRIGKGAIVGGMSGVEHDVIPYGNVKGERAYLNGLNIVGLKRRGSTKEDIRTLLKVYKQLFSLQGTLSERVDVLLKAYQDYPQALEIINFVAEESSRSILVPKEKNREGVLSDS